MRLLMGLCVLFSSVAWAGEGLALSRAELSVTWGPESAREKARVTEECKRTAAKALQAFENLKAHYGSTIGYFDAEPTVWQYSTGTADAGKIDMPDFYVGCTIQLTLLSEQYSLVSSTSERVKSKELAELIEQRNIANRPGLLLQNIQKIDRLIRADLYYVDLIEVLKGRPLPARKGS